MTYTELKSQVMRLPLRERRLLVESLKRSLQDNAPEAERGRSAAGKDLMEFVGVISPEDAQEMREAIEQGCEQVVAFPLYDDPLRTDSHTR